MEAKFVEIRDRGTMIPALAIRIDAGDSWLARVAGFGVGAEHSIILTHLQTAESHIDPYCWSNARTCPNAHVYLEEHWDLVPNDAVVDVEFILGETAAPKESERNF